MSDDWNLATLVVGLCAIALTLSPASLNLIASVLSNILRLTWPPLAKCERLEWQHVSDGPLHECPSSPQFCDHIGPHDATQTWDQAMTNFFTMRRGDFVRKPKQLSLGTRYVRTDAKTLKVFLSLLNVRENEISEEGVAPFRVVFKQVEGLMTAYIQLQRSLPAQLSSFHRLSVTRREMELILQGYPPWYQNPLALPGGRHVPHPIIDESDLSRGGWVVAVGLSPTLPIASDFMERDNGRVVILDRALRRITQCLRNLEQAFPQEGRVSTARELAEWVVSMLPDFGYSGSHLDHLYCEMDFKMSMQHHREWRSRYRPVFADELTDQQIVATMKIFNFDKRLTSEETDDVRPVLEIVIQAAMCGIYKVVSHLYVTGSRDFRRPTLLPELERDELIYVRGRWEARED